MARKEVTVWVPEGHEFEAPRRRMGVRGVATLAALALLGTGVAVAKHKDTPENDTCTNINHQFVTVNSQGKKNGFRGWLDKAGWINDERSWSGVADALSEDRGWEVNAEQFAAINKNSKAIVRDSKGVLKDTLRDGQYCLAVPGPTYSGVDIVENSGETIETIADEQGLKPSFLHSLNPQLARTPDTAILPIGMNVRVDDEITAGLVYREMKEPNINSMGNVNTRARILMANVALMGSDQTPTKTGSTGYFPLRGGTTSNGKKYGPNEIWATYHPEFTPINVGAAQITERKKNPPRPKPKPTTRRPTPERNDPDSITMGRIVSRTTTGAPVPATINGHPYFSQWDERYAHFKFPYKKNDKKTIQTSGCGPTSLADVVAGVAGRSTNPIQEAKWILSHGYRGKGGTEHGGLLARPRAVGLKAKSIKQNVSAIRQITNNEHGMVIVNGSDEIKSTPATDAGHIYVVYHVTKDGRLQVLDPNSVTKSLKLWQADTILGPASIAYGITR